MIALAVTAEVDVKDVEDGLRGMARRASKFAPAFREMRRPLREDQREHGREESGPDGKWPARSPKTLERARARPRGRTLKGRRRRARKLRALLGKLPRLLRVRATGLGVFAESAAGKMADAHQDGARVGRGGKSRLPRRTFLYLSPKMLSTAERILVEHVYGGWLRRALGLRRI